MEVSGLVDSPRNVDGVVGMMLDATQNYMKPLATERLFGWQAALFPTGYSGMYKIEVGKYRSGDMQLARSDGSPQRFYSMSNQILTERKKYYEVFERTQRSDDDITEWLKWFLSCLGNALTNSREVLESVLAKAKFWEQHSQTPLNDRQRLMLNKLFDGFEGKLTFSKWAKIAKCSQDTAIRDIIKNTSLGNLHYLCSVKNGYTQYIQVSYTVKDKTTLEREFAPFRLAKFPITTSGCLLQWITKQTVTMA